VSVLPTSSWFTYHGHMSELPSDDVHEVIHLGGETAVVVPLNEYRRLRQDALRAQLIERADEEEAAAVAAFHVQQAAGSVVTVPQADVRRRFGLADQ
jgi:hypothetical protein